MADLIARPRGATEMEVTLRCPVETRPIAWSLDLASPPDAPFRADWHAERGTGRRPREVALVAVVPRSPSMRARVYFADGKVATPHASLATASRDRADELDISPATAPGAGPTSSFEAPP
jgi:hypothetical protein